MTAQPGLEAVWNTTLIWVFIWLISAILMTSMGLSGSDISALGPVFFGIELALTSIGFLVYLGGADVL